MSWIKLTSVTATNGSKIVVVNSGSTTGIKAGDALKLGAFDVYEIEGVFAAQIQLREPWGNATQNNAAAVVVPTFGDFNAAVEAMRSLTEIAVSNLTALEQWGTQTGTVNFQGQDGETHTARTLLQMDADVQEKTDAVQQATDEMTDLIGAQVALTQPDVYIPFNDSLQIVRGYGTHDKIDVSAAQDGSVMVELPTKSVDFSRASVVYGINKSGVLQKYAPDSPVITDRGISISQSTINQALYNTDFSQPYWSKEGGLAVSLAGDEYQITDGESIPVQRLTSAASEFNSLRVVSSTKLTNDKRLYWAIVRAGSLSSFSMSISNNDGTNQNANVDFDLTDKESISNANLGILSHGVLPMSEGFCYCYLAITALTDGGQEKIVSISYQAAGVAGETIDVLAVGINSGGSKAISLTSSAVVATSADFASIPMQGNLPSQGESFTAFIDVALGGRLAIGNSWGYDALSGGRGHSLIRDGSNGSIYFLQVGLSGVSVAIPPELKGIQARHALRYDRATGLASFFVNGNQIGSSWQVDGFNVVNYATMSIGRWAAGDQYTNGTFECVMFFNRPLSNAEIFAMGKPKQ